MSSSMELLLLAIFIFLYWGTLRLRKWQDQQQHKSSGKEVPFGYTGIPGVGFLINFRGPDCQRKLIKIREKYGKICKIRMGSFDCVWLNDYNFVKEAWHNSAFCGRPDIAGISIRTKHFIGGIIFNHGKPFIEQRRFAMQTLKTVGLGKNLSEQFIVEEIEDVITTIKKNLGRPLCTRHLFNIPAFNIIWRIMSGGSRFQHDNPEMSQLVTMLNRNMELNDGACAAFFMPWLSKYFGGLVGWQKYVGDANFIFDFWMKFAEKTVKNHLLKTDEEDENYKNSFLKAYVDRIMECTDTTSTFYGDIGIKSLATVLQDFFIAGSETTATTLQWICLYLASFPECQRKMLQEIRHSTSAGENELSEFKSQLPYTQAFIKESLRFSTLAPLGMVHSTLENVEFRGYFIPKNSLVYMNACAVHYDPNYWINPEKFQPERFLTEGKLIAGEIPGYLPFSLGKRMCPGAEVAKQTLFLAVVDILKVFEIRAVCNDGEDHNGCEGIELRPKIGVSAVPYPHKLLFIDRLNDT